MCRYLQQEQEAAAQVYEEFVASFEDSGKGINRSWVKGGTVNPDKSGELMSLFCTEIDYCR